MNDATNGKHIPTDNPDESSGCDFSSSGSGENGSGENEDCVTTTTTSTTSDPTKENPETAIVDVIAPSNEADEPKEVARGGASYTHKSIFLLITSLLVLLLG